jgi:hypothetical protein
LGIIKEGKEMLKLVGGEKAVKIPKGVDLDFAFGVLKVIYECMTDIKEGKFAEKVAPKEVEKKIKGKVEEHVKAEEFIEEPEISFKDAFAALNSLGSTFEPGIPTGKEDWRVKLTGREDEVKYLKTGLRYWYSDDWYGSERRKKPA